MTHYPGAELCLWKYDPANPAYFKGINRPVAVVLHVAQGWASTARRWAADGYAHASWHYFVCLDGTVIQQLEHEDGGYHAGIASPPAPTPTWPLWKGSHLNINCYTIGIEHEGFSGDGFTDSQAAASRALCRWLSSTLGFPYDREHFPAHAEIDLINRPSDFAPPEGREAHYQFMFEEDEMTPEQAAKLDAVYAALTGGVPGVIEAWNANGNSVLVSYNDLVFPHLGNPAMHTPPTGIPKHQHDVAAATTGDPR